MNKTELKIKTRDFGEVTVQNDSIITFPNGVYAFEELKSFVLLSPLGENMYPMWLQSAEKTDLCFIVFDPLALTADYTPAPEGEALTLLDYEEGDELSYLAIAVVPEDYKQTTVNLKSPVVINRTKSKGTQVILDADYKLKYPIFSKKGES